MLNRFYSGVRLSYLMRRVSRSAWRAVEGQAPHAARPYYSRSRPSSTQILSTLQRSQPVAQFHSQIPQRTPLRSEGSCFYYYLIANSLVGALGYYLYWSNVKKPVIDKSVLKTQPEAKDLLVVPSHEFSSAGTKHTVGRSQGHKVQRKDPQTGESEYFYYKEVVDRKALLNELVAGGLARELCGPDSLELNGGVPFPLVLLHETPVNDAEDRSRYALLSESVGNVPYSNLEDWAKEYFEDRELAKYKPRHLGVALALDGLLGKTDCKLANLIGFRDRQGNCYSIDHESAFRSGPKFIESADDALSFIGEFREKSITEFGHEENCPGLDTRDDPNQPLKARLDIQVATCSILKRAIQNDIDNGRIAAFYKKFASLSEAKLKKIIGQYGLLTAQEQSDYLKQLKNTQKELQAHIDKSQRAQAKSASDFRPF